MAMISGSSPRTGELGGFWRPMGARRSESPQNTRRGTSPYTHTRLRCTALRELQEAKAHPIPIPSSPYSHFLYLNRQTFLRLTYLNNPFSIHPSIKHSFSHESRVSSAYRFNHISPITQQQSSTLLRVFTITSSNGHHFQPLR
jgi:hypothetical protein